MQFAKIGDVTLHYQVIGAPAGKPLLVFSNSLGTDFRIWRDVIVRLVGEFSILTYDKRGHGLSDTGRYPYSMDDHVSDLEGLLDHLGVSDAIVCGLSVGGLIAQGLFHKRPDLVKALILCDTGLKIGNDEMWNTRIETAMSEGIGEMAEGILERWFTEKFRSDDNAEFAGYRNMLIRTPEVGYAGTSAAIRDTDFRSQAQDIDVPTLCVVGDEDGATPPSLVEEMAKSIPDARYEKIKNAGHLPCIEQPAILTEIIKAYCSQFASAENQEPPVVH